VIVVELPLAVIQLDERTQVRASIKKSVVASYAAQMAIGSVFPPIVVFVDDVGTYRVADGFHRVSATDRNGGTTILAEVHQGSLEDAIWYAAGANRTHGLPPSRLDKTRMVEMLLANCPEKTGSDIARQVGCSPSLVTRTIQLLQGKLTTELPAHGREREAQRKREEVRALLLAGGKSTEVQKATHAHGSVVADVRRELGMVVPVKRTKATRQKRLERIREMAEEGHTTHQIAADVGLSYDQCRHVITKASIPVRADAVTRNTRLPDGNRIVAQIVADAENLLLGAKLIDFKELDPTRLADWIHTLQQARIDLGVFIKRVKQQEQCHVEAANSHALQNSPSPDFVDSDADSVGDTTGVP